MHSCLCVFVYVCECMCLCDQQVSAHDLIDTYMPAWEDAVKEGARVRE